MGTHVNLNESYHFYYNFRVCDSFNWLSLQYTYGKKTLGYTYNYSHIHRGTHTYFLLNIFDV